MLNIFSLSNGRLVQEEIESLEELTQFQPIWVDLESPTLEEKRWIKQHYGLSIPEDATDEDIEESARFYEEDIPVFRLLRLRARRAPGLIEEAKEVLLKLFDADAEYSADTLEGIYDDLKKVSAQVLDGNVTDSDAQTVLADIARQEDLNGRIRRNMLDTRRAVSFMMRSKMLNAEQFEDARQILRDIESLDSHTQFLFDKINFLMDATVGFLSINQNKIIKIFSVASVALLPPTLIASVYGMNFRVMPELEWEYGYVYVIALMIASALGPMIYFRKRGWLR